MCSVVRLRKSGKYVWYDWKSSREGINVSWSIGKLLESVLRSSFTSRSFENLTQKQVNQVMFGFNVLQYELMYCACITPREVVGF